MSDAEEAHLTDASPLPLPDLALFESTLSSLALSSTSTSTLLSSSLSSPPSYPEGISLLSLKNNLLLAYLHNLALLALARLHGSTPDERTVKELVRERIALEKIKPLEIKLRYQVDKLVKMAEQDEGKEGGEDQEDGGIDPLAFKPNLAALSGNVDDASGSEDDSSDDEKPKAAARARIAATQSSDGIYRPPRLAPVAYTEEIRKGKKERRPPPNTLLRDLAGSLADSTHNPYTESTSGLGGTPSLKSKKAQKLDEITRYEEENFTRLFMNKKDAKRRRMDEEDIALGGTGSKEDYMVGAKGVRGKREYGFENELGDLLGVIGKKRKTGQADGYDALRAMRRERKPIGASGDSELINTNGVPSEKSRGNRTSGGAGGRPGGRTKFDNAVKRSTQAGKKDGKRRQAKK